MGNAGKHIGIMSKDDSYVMVKNYTNKNVYVVMSSTEQINENERSTFTLAPGEKSVTTF